MASSGRAAAIVKHSLVIAGHSTSVSLEDAFWSRLKIVAGQRERSVAALVAEIDAGRGDANLSSAVRVFLLEAGTAPVPDRHAIEGGDSRAGQYRPAAVGSLVAPDGDASKRSGGG